MMTQIKYSKILVVVIGLFLSHSLDAQHHFGAKLGLGISKSDKNFNTSEYRSYEAKYVPSGTLGLYYNFDLSERFFIGVDIICSQLNGRENSALYSKKYETNEGETVVVFEDIMYWTIKHQFTYLTLPIYAGINLNDFEFTAGLQVAMLFRERFTRITNFPQYIGVPESIVESKSSVDDPLDFGINLGLGYSFNDKWKVHTNFYQGMNDLNVPNEFDLEPTNPWRNSQFVLGVSFGFL
ncbi:MAG: outer membrane beta-barrel protein [Crocinitomix sp.]|nr:outer membrane beta-barrel protein [Crocinitomix sp.]